MRMSKVKKLCKQVTLPAAIQLGFFTQKSTLDCKLKYQVELKSLQSSALEKELELAEIENLPAAKGMEEVSLPRKSIFYGHSLELSIQDAS